MGLEGWGSGVRLYFFVFSKFQDCLCACFLCLQNSTLLPWILLYCYFRRWHDCPPGNIPGQLSGKRLSSLGYEMREARRREGCGLGDDSERLIWTTRPQTRGLRGGADRKSCEARRWYRETLRPRKYPFLGFCVGAEVCSAVLCLWGFFDFPHTEKQRVAL